MDKSTDSLFPQFQYIYTEVGIILIIVYFYDGSSDFNSSTCDSRSITCKKRYFIWLLELNGLIAIFINCTLVFKIDVSVVSKRIWSLLNITGIVSLPCLGVVLFPPYVRLQSPLQFSAELFSSSVTQSPCIWKTEVKRHSYISEIILNTS